MVIKLFKNRLDDSMKRFGSFLSNIQKKSTQQQSIELISDDKKQTYLKKITSDGTNIFVCHGAADSLYHRYHCSPKQVLIDKNSKKKLGKVIAISCGTGRELGKKLVDEGYCSVYLGFNSKLHFNKKSSSVKYVSSYYSQYLKELYKEVFEEVLTKAIDNTWTFDKTARVLEWELRRKAVVKAQLKKEKHPHFYKVREINQTIVATTNVAKNIVVHGDRNNTVD